MTADAPRMLWWHWTLLAAILLLAAALRVHDLGRNSLWMDELFSVEASSARRAADFNFPMDRILDHPPHLARLDGSGPTWRVWTTLGHESHPPLYFLTLRIWRDAFGSSDVAMRSLSVLISLVGIALLFDLGRHLLGPAPALWACLIGALAHTQIWHAQDLRGYGLATAAVIGAAAAAVRMTTLGPSRPRTIAFAASLLIAMLTNYYALAGCLAVTAYAAIRLRGPALRHAAFAVAVAAILFALIWGPFAWQQLGGAVAESNAWTLDHAPGFATRWAARLLNAPARLLSPPSSSMLAPAAALWLLVLLPALLRRRRDALLLPLLLAIIVIALPAAVDACRRSSMMDWERYYLSAAPALYLLGAGLLADRRQVWLRHALPAALTLYCLASLPWAYVEHNADWRALGAHVSDSVRPDRGDVVLFFDPSNPWYARLGYLAVDHYARTINPAVAALDSNVPATLPADLHARHGVIWLFTAMSEEKVRAALPGFQLTQPRLVRNCGIFYRLAPTDEGRR